MRNPIPLMILAAAQFVMVLDSSVMNVSISQIVADLHTTIAGVQLAITAYTLVMAAFMLVGAKIGDIIGRDRAFAIGLLVYGVGSGLTAVSPNLWVLLFGWSFVEGIGAVLVVPAIAALIAANYEGKERALAYGVIGGVAAAAIAVGPVIGGAVTTFWTWRLVFAGEVIIVLGILAVRRRMAQSPKPENPPRLDVVGAALSATGLGLIVFAILQSSSWGWVQPRGALTIGDTEITPLGFSAVPFLILAGLGFLYAFTSWEERVARRGEVPLLELPMLGITHLRAGLTSLAGQQLVTMGTFFALPVYLQVVLGLDALHTGLKLVPMSATMFLAALSGPRLAAGRSPKQVVRLGLILLCIGALIVLATIDVQLDSVEFAIGLGVFGAGVGLMASQLGNVIMSSVGEEQSNQAGGLQGTAQNLGSSLGTALIGAILIGSMTSAFVVQISQNQAIPESTRTALAQAADSSGLEVVPVADAEAALVQAGLPQDQAASIAADYGTAQLEGLRTAMGGVALLAVLSWFLTRNLPGPAKAVEAARAAPTRVTA
jgi:MFS family permease